MPILRRLMFVLAAVMFCSCVVVPLPLPRAGKVKSCPPGKRWSDGQCHSKGKGHDPQKHKHKGKKRRH